MSIPVRLNGKDVTLDAAPGDTLLEALRRHGSWSSKHGCESGECGACAVMVDGVTRASCVMLAEQARGRSLTTAEALGTPEHLSRLQRAFVERGAIQCGFCTPAMLLVATELLERCPNPTLAEVKDALSGTLCRCTGYARPVEAVLAAARPSPAES